VTQSLLPFKHLRAPSEDPNASKKLAFAEQPIPVSVHAWMDGLERKEPSRDIRDYLTFPPFRAPLVLNASEHESALDVSDTLIFDYLIDGEPLGEGMSI
jgi:hypothetical protein